MAIEAGETTVLKAEFDSAPLKPVDFTVQEPDGRTTTVQGTEQSTGVFTVEYTPSTEGVYEYQAESADGGVEVDSFYAADAV
jgi:hypothetical protein